jgi:LysR family glycine cleavage system transcriptional activator
MDRLPPLNSLKSFEAAARHLSFTAAALELHVTHGAVSRQVALLEQHLNTPLFARAGRGLKLTDTGTRLAASVTGAFDILKSAAAQVAVARPTAALRVSAPPTLAMWWLMPRLTALHHAHPALRVEISTSTEPVDFNPGTYDAAIRRIDTTPKGMRAERFLDGRSVPVCSPRYQQEHGIATPRDIASATVVVTRSEPGAWERWLRTQAVRRPTQAPTLVFDELYFALQAALDSLGIALAPLAIVADEVQRGRLCVLAQPEEPAVRKYALLWPRASARQAEASTLASWLREPGPA